MTIRPGQHVDPQGQIFHPYLDMWSSIWDVSRTLTACLLVQLAYIHCAHRAEVYAEGPPRHPVRRLYQGAPRGVPIANPDGIDAC